MDAEVSRLAAAKSKAQRVASKRGQTCSELHAQCQALKERLQSVLHDQRRLVVQLGLAQQRDGKRSEAMAAGNGTSSEEIQQERGAALSQLLIPLLRVQEIEVLYQKKSQQTVPGIEGSF